MTGLNRTLLDLAEVAQRPQLERALEEAEGLRLLDAKALRSLCERSRGRRGLKPLMSALSDMWGPLPDTRSELERRFVELCRAAGVPLPAMNVTVAGFEVDAIWPQERVIVELDGYAFHRTRAAFERDRERDAELQLARQRVVRLTARRIRKEPDRVVRQIRGLLAELAGPDAHTSRG